MSRARRFLPLLAAVWLILELWLLITAGSLIGWFPVLALLVLGAAAGAVVVKRSGLRALRGEPAQAVPVVGGLLLAVPGFLTDVAGLLFLFPPTGALVRRAFPRLARRSRGPLGDAFRMSDRIRVHQNGGGSVVVGEVVDEQGDAKGAKGANPRRDPRDPYGYGQLNR